MTEKVMHLSGHDSEEYVFMVEDGMFKFNPQYKHVGQVSDGYHTFDELYAHRYALWFKLCELLYDNSSYPSPVIKAKRNYDGTYHEGYFILAYIDPQNRKQLSYHLPMEYWDKAYFAKGYETYPDFDGHTSNDVLERLGAL